MLILFIFLGIFSFILPFILSLTAHAFGIFIFQRMFNISPNWGKIGFEINLAIIIFDSICLIIFFLVYFKHRYWKHRWLLKGFAIFIIMNLCFHILITVFQFTDGLIPEFLGPPVDFIQIFYFSAYMICISLFIAYSIYSLYQVTDWISETPIDRQFSNYFMLFILIMIPIDFLLLLFSFTYVILVQFTCCLVFTVLWGKLLQNAAVNYKVLFMFLSFILGEILIFSSFVIVACFNVSNFSNPFVLQVLSSWGILLFSSVIIALVGMVIYLIGIERVMNMLEMNETTKNIIIIIVIVSAIILAMSVIVVAQFLAIFLVAFGLVLQIRKDGLIVINSMILRKEASIPVKKRVFYLFLFLIQGYFLVNIFGRLFGVFPMQSTFILDLPSFVIPIYLVTLIVFEIRASFNTFIGPIKKIRMQKVTFHYNQFIFMFVILFLIVSIVINPILKIDIALITNVSPSIFQQVEIFVQDHIINFFVIFVISDAFTINLISVIGIFTAVTFISFYQIKRSDERFKEFMKYITLFFEEDELERTV